MSIPMLLGNKTQSSDIFLFRRGTGNTFQSIIIIVYNSLRQLRDVSLFLTSDSIQMPALQRVTCFPIFSVRFSRKLRHRIDGSLFRLIIIDASRRIMAECQPRTQSSTTHDGLSCSRDCDLLALPSYFRMKVDSQCRAWKCMERVCENKMSFDN